jgi:hypothetical protein
MYQDTGPVLWTGTGATEAGSSMVLSERARTGWSVLICLAAYLGACWIFLVVRDRSVLLSILAIFAIVGAAQKLHSTGRDLYKLKPFVGRPWLLAVVLLAPGTTVLVLWFIGVVDNGGGFFGLAALYLGLGLVVDYLRDLPKFAETWGWQILAGSAAIAVVGVASMATLGANWTVWPLLFGVVAFPVGLSLLSEVGLNAFEDRTKRGTLARPRWLTKAQPRTLAIAGGGVFAIGLAVIAFTTEVSATFIAIFAASVLLLMLAIAAKSNADVVIVVAMAALVWTLTGRSVPLAEFAEGNQGERVIVALGDSYISGEGADEFYEGTNDAGSNTCRRSPTAYPALLALEDRPDVPRDLVFLACSGARADGVRDQLERFTQLREQNDLDVGFVLLSVGGNDALFGNVGRTCLMPGDCSELSNGWTDNLDQVGSTLDGLYAEIRQAIPDAPVLVVPYPIPISEESCDYSAFSNSEHRFLVDFTTRLNEVVGRSAADAGFYVVDTMPDALAQHKLCDDGAGDVGVNFFSANSVRGTLEQSISPINWFHNSLHPNVRGHELMRAALLRWLDENPNLPAVAPSSSSSVDGGGSAALPTTADPDTTTPECQGLSGAALESCTGTWRVQQIGRFLLTTGLIALIVAVGAWLMALPIIRLSRKIFPVRRDDWDVPSDQPEQRETAVMTAT